MEKNFPISINLCGTYADQYIKQCTASQAKLLDDNDWKSIKCIRFQQIMLILVKGMMVILL